MGGGVSRPLGNSHGNNAELHRELVAHALLRREELKGATGSKYNTYAREVAKDVIREIKREEREEQQENEAGMYSEDTRTQMRNAERNKQFIERNKMAKEDKPGKRKGGRGRRRD